MKLTESQLKRIIREELEALELEEIFTLDDIGKGLRKGYDAIFNPKKSKPKIDMTGATTNVYPPPGQPGRLAGDMTKGPTIPAGSDGGPMSEPETYQTPTVDAAGGYDTIYTDKEFEKARGEDSMRSILKKVGGMKALLKLPTRHPLRKKYRKLYRAAIARRKPAAPARQKGAAERGAEKRAARGQGAVIVTDKNKDIVAQLKKVNAEEGRAFRAINDPANKNIEGALRMKLKQIQAEKKRLEAAANAANK